MPPGHLQAVASALLKCIERDEDLLQFDYLYKMTDRDNSPGSGSESGFRVRGYSGSISTRPNGFCRIELMEAAPNGQGRVVEILDMRNKRELELDSGQKIKIYKRKKEFSLTRSLRDLLTFLDSCTGEQLEIRHSV